jgi:hypothetical protein
MNETKSRVCAEDDNSQGIIQFMREAALIDEASIRSFIIHFNPDRRRNFKLFEYVVARKFGAILWEKVPRLAKTSRSLVVQDSGVDCVTPDFAHAIQAKWHRATSQVSFTELSTFFATGALMKATRLTIVTSEGVSLKVQLPNLEHVVISNDEYVQILVSFLPPVAAVEADGSGELARKNRELANKIAELVGKNTELVGKNTELAVKNANLVDANAVLAVEAIEAIVPHQPPRGARPARPPRTTRPPQNVHPPPNARPPQDSRTVHPQSLLDRTCDKCGKVFDYPANLRTHKDRVRPCTVVETANPAQTMHKCQHCDRPFASRPSMLRHIRQYCKMVDVAVETKQQHTTDRQFAIQNVKIEALSSLIAKLLATQTGVDTNAGGVARAPIAGVVNNIQNNVNAPTIATNITIQATPVAPAKPSAA